PQPVPRESNSWQIIGSRGLYVAMRLERPHPEPPRSRNASVRMWSALCFWLRQLAGTALQMLVQSANPSLEFWTSDVGLDYSGRYSCVFSGCSRPVPAGLLTRSQRNACRMERPLESRSE